MVMPQRKQKRDRAPRKQKSTSRPSKAVATDCRFCNAAVPHRYGMAAHFRTCLRVNDRGPSDMLVGTSNSSSDSDDSTQDGKSEYSSGSCDELGQEGTNLPVLARYFVCAVLL